MKIAHSQQTQQMHQQQQHIHELQQQLLQQQAVSTPLPPSRPSSSSAIPIPSVGALPVPVKSPRVSPRPRTGSNSTTQLPPLPAAPQILSLSTPNNHALPPLHITSSDNIVRPPTGSSIVKPSPRALAAVGTTSRSRPSSPLLDSNNIIRSRPTSPHEPHNTNNNNDDTSPIAGSPTGLGSMNPDLLTSRLESIEARFVDNQVTSNKKKTQDKQRIEWPGIFFCCCFFFHFALFLSSGLFSLTAFSHS